MVLSIITGVFGLITLVLGYLVRYQNFVEIIAGYDPKKVTDSKGLAAWVGGHLILMGVLGVTSGLVGAAYQASARYMFWTFMAAVVLLSIKTATGTKRY